MPGETQGEEGAVADEETVTRGWEGLCPGELRNPFSSCCGRCITKMQTSPENQSRSWHKCSQFWFDTLEIWKLQLDEILLLFFNIQVHDRGRVGPVACVPKALTQGLGFLNRLEDRLEEQSSTACGRRLCGIRWDWHFCWWPAKSILCEGWLNHQTPSGKRKTSNVTTQDCLQSTVRNLVHIHESRVAKWKSALDPQVPPQQFGGATQSGPKSAYWNPYQAWLHQKHTKLMEGVDHRITHLLRSFQLQLRGCGGSISLGSLPLQALGVDTQEVPHGTHVALLGGLMDVLASGHEPNPLGAAGRGTAR